MRFYADENFPNDVVSELRALRHDCLTAIEDGRANQRISDLDLLLRASELSRAVLTINRIDFKRLRVPVSAIRGSSFARSTAIFKVKLAELTRLATE